MTTERADLAAIKARANAARKALGDNIGPLIGWSAVVAVKSSQRDVDPLLAEVADLRAKCERVEALHVPWYEVNGVRRNHYVIVCKWDGEESDLPADHVCVTDGYDTCMGEEHMVLACTECRVATDDGEVGYLLWPCATRKAIDRAASIEDS